MIQRWASAEENFNSRVTLFGGVTCVTYYVMSQSLSDLAFLSRKVSIFESKIRAFARTNPWWSFTGPFVAHQLKF